MSLLKADSTQFQLTDTGNILFQKALNNPTLGDVVAKISKGDSIYSLEIDVDESSDHVKAAGKEDASAAISKWLVYHVESVLEPLKRLENTDVMKKKEDSDELELVEFSDDAKSKAKAVMDKLYNQMGVVSRSDLQEEISALDEDSRRILRAKRIKLGPILVFLPELNKPKGVRLRGLLWSLWNNAPLPASLPADGAVSVKIDAETVNKDMYLSVGYPIYGNRAVRIDMLDRVINAVYDSAENGKFKAQHSMAEWLGCSIDDLYDVLTAMGHKRIVTEEAVDSATAEDKKTEENPETKSEAKTDEKPVLDTFWL